MILKQLKFTISDSEYIHISEMLENMGALAVTLTDAEDQPIYEPDLNTIPVWKKSQITALFSPETQLDLIIKNLNIAIYTIEKIEDKAWERVCMDQFHPVCFGKKLWICPSWHEISEPDAVIVSLDPGLAFGTGSHSTTKLCLEWLALHHNEIKNKIIIDYGCGSGILGIAAAKLGAAQVYAVDIDPQALLATQENAVRNQLSLPTLKPEQLEDIQADIIIANILANPLITLAPTLLSHLKPNGHLVLSGILVQQSDDVQKAYQSMINFDSPMIEDEWVRLSGVKNKVEN